ncbi:MAG: hypothetical protein K0U23_00700 [Gammaproteobacteria bacterium]|nr:hypothetical protein [Gammaproteobacteria bacterium]
MDLMCFGPESVGAETEFFHLVNQEKVNIIHFAQQRPFHNPFSEDKESAFIDFFIKSVRKLGAPPCAAGENDYKACVYGRNSTACVTLTNSPFSLDDYNPRAVTDTTQSICQYLNNNILIVSAGNYGRNTDDVVNLHTMDLGCTPEQLRHRLIATRFDYSGKKGELLFLDCHNYGPSVYAMAATAFQPGNCTEHPLCVSFGGYYGTSYAAPQILGVVMQIESVLRVNNVTYSADTVVDILNQGCVATTRPDLAKCLVDPPRVFEAAVKYAEKHKPTSGPKPIPEKLVPSSKKVVSRKKVPKNKKVSPKRVANSKGAMDSIGAGIYSGVINGMVRSAGNYVRQCSQQKGHDWMAAEAQAQVAMFTLLFTLRTVAEQQDAVSAATEALLFLTVQGMFYGCARVCRDLSEYTAGKGYKKLAKGLGIFAQVVEAVPMANTLLDPVEGVTGMIVGAVTERLCDHGLLTDKKQKRKSDPVSKIKRHVKKAR